MPEGMTVWDVLIRISAIVGAITAIFVFILRLSGPLRKWFKFKMREWAGYQENKKRDEELRQVVESQQQHCGSVMSDIKCELKDIRKRLDDVVKNLERNDESQINMLRNDITSVYYKYLDQKRIPTYVRELICDLYKVYNEDYKKNHFIEDIYHEMQAWETYKA